MEKPEASERALGAVIDMGAILAVIERIESMRSPSVTISGVGYGDIADIVKARLSDAVEGSGDDLLTAEILRRFPNTCAKMGISLP